MTTISRVRVAMTGFVGAPGVMTFYTTNPLTFRDPLNVFVDAMALKMPGTVTLKVDNVGDELDALSGDITGTWTFPELGAHPGQQTGTYSAPSGLAINWITTTFIGGSRLRGRTFVVPLGGTSYESDGSIGAQVLLDLRAAATMFIADAGSTFVIYSRPRVAPDPKAPRAGAFSAVVTARIADKAAILRSRRD